MFVFILVIYTRKVIRIWNKSHSNKSMYFITFCLVFFTKQNLTITIPIK